VRQAQLSPFFASLYPIFHFAILKLLIGTFRKPLLLSVQEVSKSRESTYPEK
jgi:hypothetical protein